MTSHSESKSLNRSTPEELAVALKEVLDYIAPLVEHHPNARLEPHCPSHLIIEGTHDDAWREGQQNGEAYAARKMLTILSQALGTASSNA